MSIIDSDYLIFGQSVTYTPDGSTTGTPVTAIFTESFDAEENANTVRHNGEIRVRHSEVAARPAYRDKFTITDGAGTNQDWFIIPEGVRERQALIGFDGEWVCKVARNERPVWG